MIDEYVRSFKPEDRDRIFRFFVTFSRAECALKRCDFVRKGNHGVAIAGWDEFADNISVAIEDASDAAYLRAKQYLLSEPPRRLEVGAEGLSWEVNKRREDSDTQYLLRVVRDVRNNLFHGGKYNHGPVEELARDQSLIDAAMIVLTCAISCSDKVTEKFKNDA